MAAVRRMPPVETIRVDLNEVVGADAFIEITDESRTLFQAVSGTPLDGGSTDGGTVVVSQPDSVSGANRITLTWTGTPCDTGHQLLIEPDGRTMRMFQTACEGESIPRDLVLVLTFDGRVDPADVVITLEPVTQ